MGIYLKWDSPTQSTELFWLRLVSLEDIIVLFDLFVFPFGESLSQSLSKCLIPTNKFL